MDLLAPTARIHALKLDSANGQHVSETGGSPRHPHDRKDGEGNQNGPTNGNHRRILIVLKVLCLSFIIFPGPVSNLVLQDILTVQCLVTTTQGIRSVIQSRTYQKNSIYSIRTMEIQLQSTANTHCVTFDQHSSRQCWRECPLSLKIWLTTNGIRSESSTPLESWRNGRAEVQIRVLCNIARTNMIACGLTFTFWARAIFYAADILNLQNLQYRADLKMSPRQSLFEKFMQENIEC